jgi:hypothetical protein
MDSVTSMIMNITENRGPVDFKQQGIHGLIQVPNNRLPVSYTFLNPYYMCM